MWEALRPHWGKILGTIYALILSFVYLFFGFGRMLVVALILALGYWVGGRLDGQEQMRDWLQKILPASFFDRDRPDRDR
ncbi:MAG: DUF2273 domain-containing protein [Candidatus Carbobacillus altaicus]|uniref:Small integral membrane protein n=1 Tax=Candidatus Carbonibacillus altaicus TaxID=2163959 RepID=A0A2R6Y394_9BACL|nr:DUF2273 domain-containing protein [Candidatus Carbobacillus altaicus]PTQ57150.1 MAG: hypothetical protein BSOLF_2182 [Candidatus Carbobacillus altaicus]